MSDFEYDCLQKKIVARSARRRVGARKTVTLPSDHLDEAELAGRNGPCRVYRLGVPMDRQSLESMPPDLQRAYLRRLRQRGGSEESVSHMLGMDHGQLQSLAMRHGVRFDRPDEAAWSAFLHCEKGG